MSWGSRKPVTVYNASNTNVLARVSSDSAIENYRGIAFWKFSKTFTDSFDQTSKSGYSVVEKCSRVDFFPEKAKDTAYVSIKPSSAGKGKYMFLCQDHPVRVDGYGVIVTPNFYIRNAKDEWKDTDGNIYKPTQKPSKIGADPTGLNFLRTNKSNLETTCTTTATGNENRENAGNSSAEP
ncbi:unnamed protein product [Mytilus coruscus]|uniref:Uncharacterized protein n=1 Tax=Mytilus coruscus TaxID=42192 RepID=A0A6J8EGH2_MYTCO|nr:unnamed protein product [Mytilus coruscus]